jgi:putative multiple sugar transport system permease protein
MNYLKTLFGGDPRQFGMLFALFALVAFFQIKTDGLVLTSANLMNLLNGNAYILVLAIGMVLVIIAGHIDLSVGSVAAFAGIVVAIALRDWGIPPWGGVALCLAIGALIGAWQGYWIAYVGIPGFVVTLAGMMLFRGANQFIGKSNTIPVPPQIQYLGGGYLPTHAHDIGLNDPTLVLGLAAILWLVVATVRARRLTIRLGGEVLPARVVAVRMVLLGGIIAWLTYQFASGRPGTSFPVPGLILVSLVLLYSFIAGRTILGRHIYAVGGNIQAAQLSGVNTRRVNFLVIMNMSILAALAGLMFIGRATAAGPFDGVNWELDAISAVFIGGAAVSGGVGTVIGSVIGGLVMAVLNNGLQLMGVGADMTQIIKGLVLLAAVAFDIYNKRQGRPSIIGLIFRTRTRAALTPSRAKPGGTTPAGGGHPSVPAARFPALREALALLTIGVVAAFLVVALYLPGSGLRNSAVSVERQTGTTATDGVGGFAPGSLIGVSLPQKTSENWVLAERLFQDGLKEAGFRSDVQFANGGVPEQQNQISAMVARGAKVIIVGAIDGSQLGGQLQEAEDAGALVIAYDRLLTNTAAVDYYVAYDNFKVGVLQGRALLEGLQRRKGRAPWNIELFAGSPDDANSKVFFNGAMSVLQPSIADGTLVVRSGQISFSKAATQGWKAENAQRRMDTLLAGVYAREPLHGALAPNDTLARAALTAARAAGKDIPVVTGQDSEVESIKSILQGEQYATINKDTAALVRHAIAMVAEIQKGQAPEINDDKSYNNGVKVVPAYLLEPQIVTQDNVRTAYERDPVLKRIVNP